MDGAQAQALADLLGISLEEAQALSQQQQNTVPATVLTLQEDRFAVEYVRHAGATVKAMRAAGIDGPAAYAHELYRRPEVRERIRELRAAMALEAVMTSAEVVKAAMFLARFDVRQLYAPDGSPIPVHELDEETASAIQAVEVAEIWEGQGPDRKFVGFTRKYKVVDKTKPLEMLFKYFGLYERDNKQRGLADLTDDEINARLRLLGAGT